ncbi:MAG: DUF177 domain-containing protein, partial [Candidatus Omnitrophica bacterium]|nr:DUF177 domain-containing protein [Candidatus Omnitrophota bacterium]
MKVAVESINDKELEIDESVSVSLWDMDSDDVKFVDNVDLHCVFLHIAKEILVDAHVTTRMKITCGRCLKEVLAQKKQNFKFSYDISMLGEYLTVDNDIREEVLLNFPMKVLCKPDCKGLCPGCGANLNNEV